MCAFLQVCKENIGCDLDQAILMTDDAESYYNAWRSVFGEPAHRLLLQYFYQCLQCQTLCKQLLTSGQNATYMSPAIQNEVINGFILADVVKKVNAARCFSVLADETADISATEQFAMCARYVDCDAGVVRQDFLQFVPVFDVTGQSLASVINDSLIKFGVDVQYLRGQGYDGLMGLLR